MRSIRFLALSILIAASTAARASAATPSAPKDTKKPPARLQSLELLPANVVLDRPQTTQQLLVLGRYSDGSMRDVTSAAVYTVSKRVVSASKGGLLTPLTSGTATIRASLGGRSATTSVSVRNAGGPYRWDFQSQIAPILVRGGCTGTSCHGGQNGKGGFRLDAFNPGSDATYEAIVYGGGGRRFDRKNVAASLLLRKPAMQVPHGGGVRFRPGSAEYRTLARWLSSGAPRGGDAARVERLEVVPPRSLLTRPNQRRRLLVTAYYSDGTREDVTDRALWESRNEGAVEVEGGIVTAAGVGEASLLIRYAGAMTVATVAATHLPPPRDFPQIAEDNGIDREIFGRLKRVRLAPVPPASDGEFLRRLTLDLFGRIPTAEETTAYLNDSDPEKRTKLADKLLASPEFTRHWRDNLNVLLMGRTAFPVEGSWGAWLEKALREDRGWDRIARELLLARPEKPEDQPAVQFLDKRFAFGDTGLDQATRDVSRIMFGVDIQCARCHAHPDVAAWQQNAYWGLSSFYARTYRLQVKGVNHLAERAIGETEYFGADKEKRVAQPRYLTGDAPQEPPLTLAQNGMAAVKDTPDLYIVTPEPADQKEKTRVPVPKYSRREAFVRQAVSPQDPYFRRAFVNWAWSQLMDRGLVEPIDQMHEGNPASHPDLLNWLADDFAANGMNVRRLVRTIVTSRTYALSSAWNGKERPSADLYAVAPVRALSPHVLAYALLTGSGYWDQARTAAGPNAPPEKVRDTFEAAQANNIAELRKRLDPGTDLFQPSAVQALYLSNNKGFATLVATGGLPKKLAEIPSDEDAIRQAYLSVLSRAPEAEELAGFQRYLTSRKGKRLVAMQEMVWALLTSSEFRFNH